MTDANPVRLVSLTEAQWNIVAQALDVATKAGGISAAASTLPVFAEIQQQLEKQRNARPEPAAP